MNVKLIVARGSRHTQEIKLRSAETVIGRRSGCQLRIPSVEVSRRHCRLCYKDGLLTVEDLNSANGTFLNGQRVTTKHLVHPGDSLQVGPLTFEVDYTLARGAKTKTVPEIGELAPETLDDDEIVILEEAEPEAEAEAEAVEPEILDEPEAEAEEAPADGEDNYTVRLDIDDGEIGHLPEGQELRDYLSRLEE